MVIGIIFDDASFSTDNSQGEWKITVLVDEDGNWPPVRIPWDSRIILDVVAQHTDIAEEVIEYLHHVGHLLPILLTNNLKFYLWRGWLPPSK